MLNILFNRYYYILLSLIIFLTDQIVKNIISEYKNILMNKNFIIFNIDYVKNFGAAFNLFSGSRIFLSLVSSLITILLLYLILSKKNRSHIDY